MFQQSAAAAPYLGEECLLTAALPDLQRGIAPLGPPAHAATTPWTWGWSSWPPPLVDSLEKTDAGRDWGQKEKGTTEDEMAGWHH